MVFFMKELIRMFLCDKTQGFDKTQVVHLSFMWDAFSFMSMWVAFLSVIGEKTIFTMQKI